MNNELVTQHTAINQIRAAVERIEAAVLETPAAAASSERPEQFPLANRNEFAECDRLLEQDEFRRKVVSFYEHTLRINGSR